MPATHFRSNTKSNNSNNYKSSTQQGRRAANGAGPAVPASKWIPKEKALRSEEEDEDTTDVSGASQGSPRSSQEEVATESWSCPSEEEESLCRNVDSNDDHKTQSHLEEDRNGGQVLLALLQGPSTPQSKPASAPALDEKYVSRGPQLDSTMKSTPLPTPALDEKPAPGPALNEKPARTKLTMKTKLTTSAAIFVPRGAAAPAPLPEPVPMPTMPVSSAFIGGFVPATLPDGHSAVQRAMEEAFPGKPWGLCVSNGAMPETGCIEVEVALRVPPSDFKEASSNALANLQVFLVAQGPQIKSQKIDVSESLIKFTFSEVPSDQCCWEFLHLGHCPRPHCRWPHSYPIPYIVRLSVHAMGERPETQEKEPFQGTMEELPAPQQDPPLQAPMMPVYGLPPKEEMLCQLIPTSGADALPAGEPQTQSSGKVSNPRDFKEEKQDKEIRVKPACTKEDVVILPIDDDFADYEHVELAFGTVHDSSDDDDWVTQRLSTSLLNETQSVAELDDKQSKWNFEAPSLVDFEEKQDRLVTRPNWADLPEEDDGLPSGPLEPIFKSAPASPASQPKAELAPASPAILPKAQPEPTSPSRKNRFLKNRKVQWKAKA